MKNIFNKRVLSLVLCACFMLVLSACGKEAEEIDVPEVDVPTVEVPVTDGGSIWLPEGFEMPLEAGKMNSAFSDGKLYGAFNFITFRTTEYFTTGGSITLSANISLFALANEEYTPKETKDSNKNVAVSLWRKDGDYAQYIATANFLANGTDQSTVFSGLDAAAEYRVTFTYSDLARTRIKGTFSAVGVSTAQTPVEDDSTVQE